IKALLNSVDQSRTHDHTIGALRDRLGLLGGLHAKSDDDGKRCSSPDSVDVGRNRLDIWRRRPGDPGYGYIIDETARVGEHGGQTLGIRGRGCKADEIQPTLDGRNANFAICLWRHINDDQAVDTRGPGIPEKSFGGINVY